MSLTRFSRAMETTICRPPSSGVAPPTIEVLPPWGTSGAPAAAHSFTASASSATEPGRTTQGVRPR